MALDPIKGAVFLVAMLGFTRSVYKKLEEYAVKKDAKKIHDVRKALYTEIPEHRLLQKGELGEKREALAKASPLEGFVHLGDYVDAYAPGSAFAKYSEYPYRASRSDDGTIAALQFHPPTSTIVRTILVTELTNGDWVVTENNGRTPVASQERPKGMETEHLPPETTALELVGAHRTHVTEATAKPDVRIVGITSFEDFVASHERRWDLIRADRKKNGYVRPGEIAFPAKVKPPVKKRVYEEIAKIFAFEARRS